ncbi:MAG: pilus assembly protein TadG-related protein, partial [Gaiellaceae bacterium]
MSSAPRASLRRNRQAGQVVILFVLVLVVLLGTAALVVDLGYAYYTKRSLQASADAAALAGASGLPNSSTALDRAREYSGSEAGKNERDNVPPVTTSVTAKCVSIAPCNPVNAIVVEETTTVSTRFARILGFDEMEVTARATACS